MSRTTKTKKLKRSSTKAARGAPRKAKPRARRRAAKRGAAAPDISAFLEEVGVTGRVPAGSAWVRKPRPAKGTYRGDAPAQVPLRQAFDFGSGSVLPLKVRKADVSFAFYTSKVDLGWLALEVDARRTVKPDLPTLDLGDGKKLVGLREGQLAYLNGSSSGMIVENSAEVARCTYLKAEPARLVIEDVIARFGAPSWLATEARRLARLPGPLARALAVGMLGRLWSRGTVPEAKVRSQILAGVTASQRAQGWWRGLDDTTRGEVEATALDQAGFLLDSLTSIDESATSDRELAKGLASRWLDDRDDLQSIAWLMGPDSATLAGALASLDREAISRLALLADLGVDESPRRSAASWMEPEAWWAGVR